MQPQRPPDTAAFPPEKPLGPVYGSGRSTMKNIVRSEELTRELESGTDGNREPPELLGVQRPVDSQQEYLEDER